MKTLTTSAVCGAALTVALFLPTRLLAQEATTTSAETSSAVRELQDEVSQLRSLIDEMRAENAESRAEMQRLRQDLQSTRALLEGSPRTAVPLAPPVEATRQATAAQPESMAAYQATGITERVQKLEESTALLGSKVDEQYQTKVETASKYRARLHGIVLMNAFRNVGNSDNFDFPTYADPVSRGTPNATVGATLRQSEIGVEVFGPTLAGARSSADVQLDFAGGFPAVGNGVNFGIVRLQTASLRLDWDHTSVVAGQDSLFISPLSPTSFASLATPAFAFAGNLWAWTPQLRIEHRFAVSDQQTVTVQAGILDNLDWEQNDNSFTRTPQAGELSGQPAYAARTAWSRSVHGHPLSFGAAGYYGRQNWHWGRYVDAWAGMADWQIPIVPRLSLSGEFYRGRGIGGLGGGIGTSFVFGGTPGPFTPIRGLDTAGGWTQLKFQVTPKVELNGVVTQDDAYASDVRGFSFDQINGRNRGALGNVVFRPRSDLVFSAELRRLRTFPVFGSSTSLNQVNLSMGILF